MTNSRLTGSPACRRANQWTCEQLASWGLSNAHLEAWGVRPERIVELDWWESHELPGGLTVSAAPSQHFSGRGLKDRNTTSWSSFVIRSPPSYPSSEPCNATYACNSGTSRPDAE